MSALLIDRLGPIMRNGYPVPNGVNTARWVDSVALTANTAKTYTIPSDAETPAHKAKYFIISATQGPLYGNFFTTALVSGSDSLTGVAPLMWRTDAGGAFLISVPDTPSNGLSLICGSSCVVQIEAYY